MEEHTLKQLAETDESPLRRYSDPAEVREEVKSSLPARIRRYTPLEFFLRHPESLDGKAVILKDHFNIATDYPAYSSVMTRYPSSLLFHEARARSGELLNQPEYQGVMGLKDAGDECFSTASAQETNMYTAIAFALESQIVFMEVLSDPKYSQERRHIEQVKDIKPPYIHVGITFGDLTIKVTDLGYDTKTSTADRTEVSIIGGSSLLAKDIAKGRFAALTGRVVDTSEMLKFDTSTMVTSREHAELILVLQDEQTYEQLRKVLGDSVAISRSDETGLVFIDMPEDLTLDESIQLLRDITDRLKKAASLGNNNHSTDRPAKTIDLGKLQDKAVGFANHYVRDQERPRPIHAKEGSNTGIGEAAFLEVTGLLKLKQLLRQRQDQLTTAAERSTHQPDDLVRLMIAEAGTLIAEEASDILCLQGGWNAEHTEFDSQETVKLVVQNNQYQLNQVHPGRFDANIEVLEAVYDAIQRLSSENFNDTMVQRLSHIFPELNPETLREIIEEVSLTIQVGVSSCEPTEDQLSWVMEELVNHGEFCFGSPPTGSATSVAARLCSWTAHKRHDQRRTDLIVKKGSEDLTDHEQHELDQLNNLQRTLNQLKNQNTITMQKSVADKLRLNTDHAIVMDRVRPKGLNPISLAIIPIHPEPGTQD